MHCTPIFVLLAAAIATPAFAQTAESFPGLGGSVPRYRIVNPEAAENANPYRVVPTESGDPMPDVMVTVSSAQPITFGEAMKLLLLDKGIAIAFVGDDGQALAERKLTEMKFSGQLQAVIASAAEAVGASYLYRDKTLRFMGARSYALQFADASEADAMTELIRRAGGKVVSVAAQRKEVLYTANFATNRTIVAQLQQFHALRREPSRTVAATRLAVAPTPPAAAAPAQSAAQMPQGTAEGFKVPRPEIKIADGKATVVWNGEGVELVRQLAQAIGKTFQGVEGRPRPLMINVNIVGQPIRTAMQTIGNAFGNDADLVERERELLVRFR